MDYKKNTLLKDRVKESTKILKKYPYHVPVIIECSKELNDILKRKKYLVPGEVTVSHLLYSIRKQLSVDGSKALFIFSDNILLCSSNLMSTVYNEFKLRNKIDNSHDNFLYIFLQYENTFG